MDEDQVRGICGKLWMRIRSEEFVTHYGGGSGHRNLETWKTRTCVDYAIMYFNFPCYIRYLGSIFKNRTFSSQRTV